MNGICIGNWTCIIYDPQMRNSGFSYAIIGHETAPRQLCCDLITVPQPELDCRYSLLRYLRGYHYRILLQEVGNKK